MYKYLKFSNQSCLQKQVKIKGKSFCKRSVKVISWSNKIKVANGNSLESDTGMQHQFCSAGILPKGKVWHKKD